MIESPPLSPSPEEFGKNIDEIVNKIIIETLIESFPKVLNEELTQNDIKINSIIDLDNIPAEIFIEALNRVREEILVKLGAELTEKKLYSPTILDYAMKRTFWECYLYHEEKETKEKHLIIFSMDLNGNCYYEIEIFDQSGGLRYVRYKIAETKPGNFCLICNETKGLFFDFTQTKNSADSTMKDILKKIEDTLLPLKLEVANEKTETPEEIKMETERMLKSLNELLKEIESEEKMKSFINLYSEFITFLMTHGAYIYDEGLKDNILNFFDEVKRIFGKENIREELKNRDLLPIQLGKCKGCGNRYIFFESPKGGYCVLSMKDPFRGSLFFQFDIYGRIEGWDCKCGGKIQLIQ